MRYDVLLADADGTLFDFHAGERVALNATLSAFGLPCERRDHGALQPGEPKPLEAAGTRGNHAGKAEGGTVFGFLTELSTTGAPVGGAAPEKYWQNASYASLGVSTSHARRRGIFKARFGAHARIPGYQRHRPGAAQPL
jgi:phosphoglycolate phosphatase-like HAD superfamily hydrolase